MGDQDVALKAGEKLRGFARRQTEHEVALQTLDGKFRMLPEPQIASIVQREAVLHAAFRGNAADRAATCWPIWALWAASMPGRCSMHVPPVTQADIDAVMNPKPGDWATYNGRRDGNHYNPLAQINVANVKQLQPQWAFRAGRRRAWKASPSWWTASCISPAGRRSAP